MDVTHRPWGEIYSERAELARGKITQEARDAYKRLTAELLANPEHPTKKPRNRCYTSLDPTEAVFLVGNPGTQYYVDSLGAVFSWSSETAVKACRILDKRVSKTERGLCLHLVY